MWPSPFLCQYPYTWHSISFIFASLLLLEWSFFRTKQPLIIVAWRAVSLKPVSLKSSSLNRGHHPSLQVPLALRWKKVGPKSGLETSNANDTHSLALLTQLLHLIFASWVGHISVAPVDNNKWLPSNATINCVDPGVRIPPWWDFDLFATIKRVCFFVFF